jgi:hypothetical protein
MAFDYTNSLFLSPLSFTDLSLLLLSPSSIIDHPSRLNVPTTVARASILILFIPIAFKPTLWSEHH